MSEPFKTELQQHIYTHLRAAFADRSEGQLRRLAARLSELDDYKLCRSERIAFPSDWECKLVAEHLARAEPELLRTVPSADDVLNHISDEATKAGKPLQGEAKLAAFRRVQAMGGEERLIALPYAVQKEQRPADNTAKEHQPPRQAWKSPSDVTLDDLQARWPGVDWDSRSARVRLDCARDLFDERRNGTRDERALAEIGVKDQDKLSAIDRINQHRLQNPVERKAPRYSS